MGSDIHINKHTTPIDQWIDLEQKLQQTDFDQPIQEHVSAWKFFNDDLNPQEFNSVPIQIDLQFLHQHLSPHQTYLVFAITNENQHKLAFNNPLISSLAYSIKQNIDKLSYRTYIIHQKIGIFSFYIYSWFGKMSKPKLRLIALSYALKIENLLNSKKKLSILSAGGVLRNKKLQKGSVLPLIHKKNVGNKQIQQENQIHIFSIFNNQKQRSNAFIKFKPKMKDPFIENIEKIEKIEKSQGIKPPLLKLTLKPYEEVNYAQIEEEQKNGEIKFDIRTTTRHEMKMQKFQGECSQIVEGVYVSGQKVAKNFDILQKYKIKNIINCAGDYCENWFQNKSINYLTFFLKDSQNQNIECLFYRSIDYILNCLKNKTNVLIHCIQGISRSVTIATAFIIFKLGYDYKKAQQLVKQKRGIACPNNGFMVQLIQFHKRLYQSYDSLPSPRVFLVSSHCKETPNFITARLIKSKLFDPKKYMGLDSRAVYIIQAPQMVYIWVGSRCQEKKLQNYWSYAQQYVKKLQKYERASLKIKAISQGTQGKQFFSLWNLQDEPQIYENQQFTRLFAEGPPTKPGGMRKYYEKEVEQQVSNKLFIYPDDQQGLGVFEFEDLGALNILASVEGQNLRITIIKGNQCDLQIGQYLECVIRKHYGDYENQNIIIQEENIDNPSSNLIKYFS